MEDEGIVKKGTVFFVVFAIVLAIGFLIYFLFGKQNEIRNNPSDPNIPNISPEDKDVINESGIYGLFVNLEDANSYLEVKENGEFKFMLNVCEGYIEYNNENSKLDKSIEKTDDVYKISIMIISKSTFDNNIVKFSSKLVSATGVVDEYTGPYSCSPSYDYKRVQ